EGRARRAGAAEVVIEIAFRLCCVGVVRFLPSRRLSRLGVLLLLVSGRGTLLRERLSHGRTDSDPPGPGHCGLPAQQPCIQAAADQIAAERMNRQGSDAVLVPGEDAARSACGTVPNADRLIRAGAHQRPASRRKCQSEDWPSMSSERDARRRLAGLPELDGAILAGTRQRSAA